MARVEPIALPGWPRALDGLRIAVISDLHLGGWFVDERRILDAAARARALQPDVILLLGDFLAGHERQASPEIPALTRALAAFSAPLGVYAVLGNHDWWVDPEGVKQALREAHVSLLDQAVAPLTLRGARLWLVGVADPESQASDPEEALEGAEAAPGEPVLLLTHRPDLFPRVPASVALTLAGHTHGGQVRLPLLGAPIVPSRYGQRYAAGHIEEAGRHLFVTTGLGTSILPVRLGVPPEIVLLTLSGKT